MKVGRGGANALWDLSEGARCGLDILVVGTKLEGRFPPLMVADIWGGGCAIRRFPAATSLVDQSQEVSES